MDFRYVVMALGGIGYFFVFPYLFVYNFAKLVAALLQKPSEDPETQSDREGKTAGVVLISGFSLFMLFYLTGASIA